MNLHEIQDEMARLGIAQPNSPPAPDARYYNPQAETMPREQLLDNQRRQLQRLVRWAYDETPFNRRRFDEAGIDPTAVHGIEDLESLPIFRRDEMRVEQADDPPFGTMLARAARTHLQYVSKSTGTTGRPARQPWTFADLDALGEVVGRSYFLSGVRPGMVFMGWIPMERSYVGSIFTPIIGSHLGVVIAPEGPTVLVNEREAAIDYALEMSKLGPLVSYTSPVLYRMLGEAFQARGVDSPMQVLMCAAMILTPEMRQVLQTLHPHGTVTYQYGTTDGLTLGECPVGEGIHIWEDLVIMEVLDPETGKPVPEGERGELTITFLGQYAQPMIRFGIEDVVENRFADEPCACGRTHRRLLNPIVGRVGDRFTVQGRAFLPFDVEQVLARIPETTGLYQIRVTSGADQAALRVRVETQHARDDAAYQELVAQRLREGLGVPAEVELLAPGGVPISGYKAQIIVKEPASGSPS